VKRRILRLGLIVVSAIALLTGCEALEHNKRSRLPDDAKSEEEKEAGTFFKSSRPSGAMSSEGRSIERDLGIP
jgi:hypothetical protein